MDPEEDKALAAIAERMTEIEERSPQWQADVTRSKLTADQYRTKETEHHKRVASAVFMARPDVLKAVAELISLELASDKHTL